MSFTNKKPTKSFYIKSLSAALAISVAYQATALPILIPKPGVHSHGQESGRNGVAQLGDYSLLGAYKLGYTHEDTSGGAYLFENAHPKPIQLFSLEQGVTIIDQTFIKDSSGNVIAGEANECFVEHPQGAQIGQHVDMSENWIALGASLTGRGTSAERPGAPCGITPTVFLAKKSNGPLPYGDLEYSVPVPFKDVIQAVAVSDSDLAIMTVNGVYIYSWINNAWAYNTSFFTDETLPANLHGPLDMKDNRLVVGVPSKDTAYVLQKNGDNWSILTSYVDSTSGTEFGRSVGIDGDRIIVASNVATEFFRTVDNQLVSLSKDSTFAGERVAISANNAVAGLRFAGNDIAAKKYTFVESDTPSGGDNGDYIANGTIDGVNELPNNSSQSPWFVDDIDMDGNTITAGWRAYEANGISLVGALVYAKANNAFDVDHTIIDDAENERLWVDVGDYRWQKQSGNTPTENTGPAEGSEGSSNYYYVETSAEEANTWGDTAILESAEFDRSYKTLSFDYHMLGEDIGRLYVDVLINGSWVNGVWSRFGQYESNLSSQWQHSGEINITGTSAPSKIRLRYVANGGEKGDIALDNISLRYFPCDTQNSTQAVNYGDYTVDQGSCLKYTHNYGQLRLGSWDATGGNHYDIKNCDGEFIEDVAQVLSGFTAVETGNVGCEHFIYVKEANQPFRVKFGSW